jgi:UDP-N-acetylmuramoyl-tripeptide--D-alanyl-D-alanine ligase
VRPRSLQDIAHAVGGRLRPNGESEPGTNGARAVTGVSIDSRTVSPGDLFVALPGEHGDGHRFIADALGRGAAGALVRREGEGSAHPTGGALIEVDDPARALLDLARDERDAMTATVVGITGSTGKTCTKDLTAAVLQRKFRIVASPASFNNEIGLPLTILSAARDTEAVVCEMGARGGGHIRMLCRVSRPAIGVVTNVGVAHMELFGSPEALREAKAELPESLEPSGTAVLNADDPVVRTYTRRTRARVLLFGRGADADVRAEQVAVDPRTGRASFRLVSPAGVARVSLPVAGEHMVPDALAAAAVGLALEVPIEEITGGLAGARITGGRMELLETPEGLRVVNDAYNANPASMAAALKAASWMAGGARCIAVLGPMAELGPVSAAEHDRVGRLLARLRIDVLITVGTEARLIASGAEREEMELERIVRCDDVSQAVAAVRSLATAGDLILVKASRVARLERVAEALANARAEAPAGAGT